MTALQISDYGIRLRDYPWSTTKLPEYLPDNALHRELVRRMIDQFSIYQESGFNRDLVPGVDHCAALAYDGELQQAVRLLGIELDLITEIRKRAEQRIEAAKLEMFPFPNVYLTDLFPADVYSKIIEYNPFLHGSGRGWFEPPHPYSKRRQVNWPEDFSAGPIAEKLSDPARVLWRAVAKALTDDNFWIRQFYRKFPTYFELRYGSLMLDDDRWSHFMSWFFVQKHQEDFQLGPHTDLPTRVFTTILNFPETDSHPNLGTGIYEPKNRFDRCSGKIHHPADGFRRAGFAPFLPNSAFVFFKTPATFHAVEAAESLNSNQRFSGQIQYYENGQYERFYGCDGKPPVGRSVFNDLSFDSNS